MKVFNLSEMTKGWFVGNFIPTALTTDFVEVAIKKYKEGDYEPIHHHKIATEITVIFAGTVKVNNHIYKEGEILVIEPNYSVDFFAVTDVTTIVVKIPSIENDKFLGIPSA